jgi:hypothetical protein
LLPRAVDDDIINLALVPRKAVRQQLGTEVPYEYTAIGSTGNDLLLIWTECDSGYMSTMPTECSVELRLGQPAHHQKGLAA